MGYKVSPDKLIENAGGATADFITDVAYEVKNFACELWQAFPDKVAGNLGIGGKFAKAAMNKLCDPNTPPDPPDSPGWSGGQCYDIFYRVQGAIYFKQNNGPRLFLGNYDTGFQLGKIKNIVSQNSPSTGLAILYILREFENLTTSQQNIAGAGVPLGSGTSDAEYLRLENIVITTQNGVPDVCGDPPSPGYPETNPDPEVDYIKNIDIHYPPPGGGGGSPKITVPLVYAPVNFGFPMKFDLGGLDLTLDVGGLEFNFGVDSDGDGNPDAFPDNSPFPLLPDPNYPPVPPALSDKLKDLQDEIDKLKEKQKDILDNTGGDEVPPEGDTEVSDEEEDVEEKKVNLPTKKRTWIEITVTRLPLKNKIILADSAENVAMFAGYFRWLSKGCTVEEYKIDRLKHRYTRPVWADGFILYAVNEALLSYQVITEKEAP
jgi:hypothetical protein